MTYIVKRAAAGAVLGGSILCTAGLGIANAQPGDGMLNVAIGDVGTIQDVSLSNAVRLAAGVCSTPVDQAVLATVDQGGQANSTCTTAQGSLTVTFSQNAPGNSEGAPGRQGTTAPTTTTTTTTTTTPAR